MSQDPPSLPRDRIIYFLHIPKCGGNSVASNIFGRRWFSGNGTLTLTREGDDGYRRIPRKMRPAMEFIHGHFRFGLHRLLPVSCVARPGVKFTYVTMLREPTDRVLSWYHHCVKSDHLGEPSESVRGKTPWQWCLGHSARYLDNYATRLIMGEDHDPPVGEMRPFHLEIAKQNLLRYFAVVGILENYDQFIRDIRFAFNRPRIPLENEDKVWHGRKNVNPDRAAIPNDPALAAKIAQRNALDVQLYQWVRQQWSL